MTDANEKPLSYRLLTGPDDSTFCERVSEAIDSGYVLYGDPSITTVKGEVVVAQAVIRAEASP